MSRSPTLRNSRKIVVTGGAVLATVALLAIGTAGTGDGSAAPQEMVAGSLPQSVMSPSDIRLVFITSPVLSARAASAAGTGTPMPQAGTWPLSAAGQLTIIRAAQTGLGHPYVWGGTSFLLGWDCSGFVQWAYRQAGVELPRTEQWRAMVPTSAPQPGDLVAQNQDGPDHWSHVGIYVGDGMMISALNPDVGTVLLPTSATGTSRYFTLAGGPAVTAPWDFTAAPQLPTTLPARLPLVAAAPAPVAPRTMVPSVTPAPSVPSVRPNPVAQPFPSAAPTAKPTTRPSPHPSPSPTTRPTPSSSATPSPTASPSPSASPSPTASPSPSPSPKPTTRPSPSANPTTQPSPSPTPTASPKPTTIPPLATAAALVPGLAQPQSVPDIVPAAAQATLGHAGVSPATTRLLGRFGQLSYFAATDEKDRLYLFALDAQGEVTGPVFTDVAAFAVNGLQLRAAEPLRSVWLVPPASSLPAPAWSPISGNLFRKSAR